MDDHEVFIDDRFDGSGLDKTIELMAPAAPRGVKDGEDGPPPGGCMNLRSVEESSGAARRLRGGWRSRESRANGCGDCQASGRPASEHESMIIPQLGKRGSGPNTRYRERVPMRTNFFTPSPPRSPVSRRANGTPSMFVKYCPTPAARQVSKRDVPTAPLLTVGNRFALPC